MKLQAPRHAGLLIALLLMAASAVTFRRGLEATFAKKWGQAMSPFSPTHGT